MNSNTLAARRALSRMALTDSLIAPLPGGRYGVFLRGRSRETTQYKLRAETVRAWASNGAIIAGVEQGTYVLARAGAALAAREAAQPGEHYLAQHVAIETRTVMQPNGREAPVRVAADDLLARLQRLKDARGEPWFSHDELAAGLRLRLVGGTARTGARQRLDRAAAREHLARAWQCA
jgi:hypothetical protein